MKLIKFSGLCPDLALAELRAIVPFSCTPIDGTYFKLTKSTDAVNRLAYTQWISTIIIDGLVGTWNQRIRKLDWGKIITKPAYIVESHKHKIATSKSREFVSYLASKGFLLTNKREYDTLDFFQMPSKIIIAKRDFTNSGGFEARKPHTRPFHKPVSLQPRLARAMVNLLGAKPGKIHDPCCGTGGIVLEAALLGHEVSGSDCDIEMVNGSKMNLVAAGHATVDIVEQDVFYIKKQYDSIVTDLPYGLRGKSVDDQFYEKFFFYLSSICRKKAVIALPDLVVIEPLITGRWNLENQFLIPLHKTLSKRIIVLHAQQ